MQQFITLTRRELANYFLTVIGYLIVAAAVFLMGLTFVVILRHFNGKSVGISLTELFYITQFFWFILLLSAPVITMRLFALEKYSGTFETLMTAPVSDLQVVLAKFAAAMAFFVFMWLPLLGCVFVVHRYSSDPRIFDYGTLGSTYLGIFLIGALYIAFGCFASSTTRSQILAAVLSMAFGVGLFMVSFLADQLPVAQTFVGEVLNYVALTEHMETFSRGVVDSRPVAFYLSGTLFFLFLTHRVVASRRWQ
jgi:ABC-2 type transport system permease protein